MITPNTTYTAIMATVTETKGNVYCQFFALHLYVYNSIFLEKVKIKWTWILSVGFNTDCRGFFMVLTNSSNIDSKMLLSAHPMGKNEILIIIYYSDWSEWLKIP